MCPEFTFDAHAVETVARFSISKDKETADTFDCSTVACIMYYAVSKGHGRYSGFRQRSLLTQADTQRMNTVVLKISFSRSPSITDVQLAHRSAAAAAAVTRQRHGMSTAHRQT